MHQKEVGEISAIVLVSAKNSQLESLGAESVIKWGTFHIKNYIFFAISVKVSQSMKELTFINDILSYFLTLETPMKGTR
jgi:hypothetical protein